MRLCSIEGCGLEHKAKGYCGTHYSRMYRNGTLETLKQNTCTIEGCSNEHAAKGLCHTHYYRLRRNGSVESARIFEWHHLWGTPEYRAWANIKSRCYNPNNPSYKNYGGRGIRMCPEWFESFTAFYSDVGPKPSPEYSIDRIDVDGDYEPGNVRWADPITQANNKRRNKNHFEIDWRSAARENPQYKITIEIAA